MNAGRMLKIHEATTASGALSPVCLRRDAEGLTLVVADAELAVPDGAVAAVMERYGQPLDAAEAVHVVDALDLGDGRALRHVRHLARYDVIARDYLVYDAPAREPLCALATTVAGALEHLARAAARP